ncbi:hypothetical protein [Ktedonospora formicarum]|uniref:Uncharacterized protein n=1 Tax=Ktedonospora formicarum TaxID=2778364 RepID=A0A8J3MYL2_9CHLR|nr:hypothetical protein [Ktedonospora formicarum]GHO49790.1 hypothetical protein KSX_79530 [Ktedonospora formicarum]
MLHLPDGAMELLEKGTWSIRRKDDTVIIKMAAGKRITIEVQKSRKDFKCLEHRVEEPGRKAQLVQIDEDVLIMSRWLPAGHYQVEIKRKLPGGVRFHYGIKPAYDEEQLLHDLEHKGFFSARPFTVRRPYGPSCDACTATLYVSFCRVYGPGAGWLVSASLSTCSGAPFIDPPFPLLERLARWEGISMPSVWGRTHFYHLLRLLKLQPQLVTRLTQTLIGKRLR